MQESGGIFFVKKGWTIAVAVASSDFWIVIVVMGHTSKMDLASVLSQTASRIVVLETTAREEVRGKVSERGHRLHSLSPSPFGDVVKTIVQFVLLGVRIPDGVCIGNKQDNHHDQNESV
jgi:hypothetical protein